MVCNNFGLPDPPSEEEAVSTNNDIILVNESESDEEVNEYSGYEPLSTNPDNDFEEDDEDLEDPDGNLDHIVRAEDALVCEVWSSNASAVDITMDKEKEDLVKQAMLNFTLPESAIPDWAANVPEDQWKEHLMKRLESLKRSE